MKSNEAPINFAEHFIEFNCTATAQSTYLHPNSYTDPSHFTVYITGCISFCYCSPRCNYHLCTTFSIFRNISIFVSLQFAYTKTTNKARKFARGTDENTLLLLLVTKNWNILHFHFGIYTLPRPNSSGLAQHKPFDKSYFIRGMDKKKSEINPVSLFN